MMMKHIVLATWVMSLLFLTLAPLTELANDGKIVFVSIRDGNKDIYVMNADGSDVTRLTDNSAEDRAPIWSPDGKKIAFISDRELNYDIYVMNADGSNIIKVTDSFAEDMNPSWSPDGTKIAFNSDRDGHPQIYIMNADGSNVVRLTNDEDWNATPVWSPDGRRIAYSSTSISDIFTTGEVASRIRVIDIDGSNIEELTREDDSSPKFSPDGKKIVFESFRDGNFEIYVMNVDGTDQKRLTDYAGIDKDPSWSPDGEKIIFVSNRDGNDEIYVMNADGENVIRLTENSYQDSEPEWSGLETTTVPESTPSVPQPTEEPVDEHAPQPVQVVVPPHLTTSGIEWIKIEYELHGSHGIHWDYWIARHSDGDYYIDRRSAMGVFYSSTTEGQKVDRELIQDLADSFTDFYPAEKGLRKSIARLDGSVNFEAGVKLENGEMLSMHTYLDYGACCLIPWSIEYMNKYYLQLNGRISCAVFRLLDGLDEDEELQAMYGKEIRWECYPAILHYEYYDEYLSDDFPQSEPVLNPRETLGESHVVWDVAIPDVMYPSVSAERTLFVATKSHIIALNAETAQRLWEVEIEQKEGNEEDSSVGGDFVYHDGAVYLANPPTVQGFNVQTGELMWEYTSDNDGSLEILPTEDNLIVWERKYRSGGIVCLNAKSGDQIWRIAGDIYFVRLIEDIVLYEVWVGDEPFRVLADINSGEKLWEKEISDFLRWRSDIVNWSYDDGILYVDEEEEGTFVAVDVSTLEESVVYSHGKFKSEYEPGELLQYCKAFEEGILLYFIELGETDWPYTKWNTRIMFLDRTGTEVWDYRYGHKSVGGVCSISGLFYGSWEYNPIEGAEILQDTLYVWRKGGFVEAFNVQSGKRVWESEVRDSIGSFSLRDDRIYLTADDCRLYCLDAETGEILWVLKACDSYCVVTITEDTEHHFLGGISCHCPIFIDAIDAEGSFLVTTRNGVVRVSAEEQREEEPEIQKEDEGIVEEQREEESEDQKQEDEGFCLGTVLLLLFMIAGFLTSCTQKGKITC